MSQLKYEFDDFTVEINHDIIGYTVGSETVLLPARFDVNKSDMPFGGLTLRTVSTTGDSIKFELQTIPKQKEMFLMLARAFGVMVEKKIQEEAIRKALNDAAMWQNFIEADEQELSAHTAKQNVIERIIRKYKLNPADEAGT